MKETVDNINKSIDAFVTGNAITIGNLMMVIFLGFMLGLVLDWVPTVIIQLAFLGMRFWR